MQRTQISLNTEERRLLDVEAARTGKSIAALIREAVRAVYDDEVDADDAIAVMRTTRGAWGDRGYDGAEWVEARRSGTRLATPAT